MPPDVSILPYGKEANECAAWETTHHHSYDDEWNDDEEYNNIHKLIKIIVVGNSKDSPTPTLLPRAYTTIIATTTNKKW